MTFFDLPFSWGCAWQQRLFSIQYGRQDPRPAAKWDFSVLFLLIGGLTLLLNLTVYLAWTGFCGPPRSHRIFWV